MEKTVILPIKKAGFVQANVTQYNCTLTEIAVAGPDLAKVTVTGEDENVKELFDQIGE